MSSRNPIMEWRVTFRDWNDEIVTSTIVSARTESSAFDIARGEVKIKNYKKRIKIVEVMSIDTKSLKP